MFVANGDSDPMILPHYSYLLAGLIPQARVKIYPDSAHGFLFQHNAEFAAMSKPSQRPSLTGPGLRLPSRRWLRQEAIREGTYVRAVRR